MLKWLLHVRLLNLLVVRINSAFHALSPHQLLSPQRFDIALKLIYVRDWVDGQSRVSRTARDLYARHIKCWKGDWVLRNCRWDWLDGSRICIKNQTCSFECILFSMGHDGWWDGEEHYLPVWVFPKTSQVVFIAGSHRVAVALGMEYQYIPCRLDDTGWSEKSGIKGDTLYDVAYFRGYTEYTGGMRPKCALPDWHIEFAFYTMLNYIPKMLLLTIWPRAVNALSDDVIKKVSRMFSVTVWYHKKVWLTKAALQTYMLHAYGAVDWAASKSAKVETQGSGPQALSLYWLEGDSFAHVRQVRDELRRLADTKHSSHLTDTYEEMIMLSRLALFRESLRWINRASSAQQCLTIGNQMATYNRLQDLQVPGVWLHPDGVAVDSAAVLFLHGIRRRVKDIDIIFERRRPDGWQYQMLASDKENPQWKDLIPLGDHSDGSTPHDIAIEDLINHPLRIGYCFGLKFISLERVRHMKRLRSENKDKHDVVLIDDFLTKRCSRYAKRFSPASTCWEAKKAEHVSRIYDWNRSHGIVPPWHPTSRELKKVN